MPKSPGIPTYSIKNDRGHKLAAVTLTDAVTKRRRLYRLGPYGSDASRELYARVLVEWEASGRRLPETAADRDPGGMTVTQLCHAYWSAMRGHRSRSHELVVRATLRTFRQLYGTTPAAAFGPNSLRLLREAAVRGDSNAAPSPRRPLSRPVANRFARAIIGVFKWAVAHELIESRVYEALRTLEPLRRGQTDAHEPPPVKPVPDAFVDAALPHMPPPVRAMVELQRSTGMRSGEVVIMRTRDVDTTGRVWTYTPAYHKTAHRGLDRTVHLGPRAQDVLKPWLRTNLDEYLFSPAEAEATRLAGRHARRKTPMSYGNRPGTNRKATPARPPADRYTSDSYRRAITRACDKANRAAKLKVAEAGREVAADERLVPRWHPHQLRHNFATMIRREYGLEAAQILLGHSSALVTDAVYAERDMRKAEEIAAKLG